MFKLIMGNFKWHRIKKKLSIFSVRGIISILSQFIVKPDSLLNDSKSFKRGGIGNSGFAIYNSASSAYKDTYWGLSLIKIGAISTFCLTFSGKGFYR